MLEQRKRKTNRFFASLSGSSAIGDNGAQFCTFSATSASSIRPLTEAGGWQSERRLQLASLIIRLQTSTNLQLHSTTEHKSAPSCARCSDGNRKSTASSRTRAADLHSLTSALTCARSRRAARGEQQRRGEDEASAVVTRSLMPANFHLHPSSLTSAQVGTKLCSLQRRKRKINRFFTHTSS